MLKLYLLGKKKYLTPYQTQTLTKILQNKPYLKKEEKQQLANLLNISEETINRWFVGGRAQRRQAGLLAKGEEC